VFAGKGPAGGAAKAYACRGYACLEPTSDPARLATQVAELAAVSRTGS
jgi:uncharacterized protein YyaL (SSP411 family)